MSFVERLCAVNNSMLAHRDTRYLVKRVHARFVDVADSPPAGVEPDFDVLDAARSLRAKNLRL
jgi:hypothetical protein